MGLGELESKRGELNSINIEWVVVQIQTCDPWITKLEP